MHYLKKASAKNEKTVLDSATTHEPSPPPSLHILNSVDLTRVLVGISIWNTGFLLVVANNSTTLTSVSAVDNGISVGFGKSVARRTALQVAILVETFSRADAT